MRNGAVVHQRNRPKACSSYKEARRRELMLDPIFQCRYRMRLSGWDPNPQYGDRKWPIATQLQRHSSWSDPVSLVHRSLGDIHLRRPTQAATPLESFHVRLELLRSL